MHTLGGPPEPSLAGGRHLHSHGGAGGSSIASGSVTLAYDGLHRPSPTAAAAPSPGSTGASTGSSVTLRVPGIRGNVTINANGAGVLPSSDSHGTSGGGGIRGGAARASGLSDGTRVPLQGQHNGDAAVQSASTCDDGTTAGTGATTRDGSGAVAHAGGNGDAPSSGAAVAVGSVMAAGGGGGGGFLSTVLSDGRDTAKEARQAQLDIMVSAFHSALAKARYEANLMAGCVLGGGRGRLGCVSCVGCGVLEGMWLVGPAAWGCVASGSKCGPSSLAAACACALPPLTCA